MSQPNTPQDRAPQSTQKSTQEPSQQFQSGASAGQDSGNRSEGLLPADQTDPNLQVAEEVAFDLQSDASRRVGSMPVDGGAARPAEAVAEAMKPASADSSQPQPGKD